MGFLRDVAPRLDAGALVAGSLHEAVRLATAAALVLALCAAPARAADPPSIGVATMAADGTIVLRLRATGPGGAVGHGRLVYPPGDAKWRDVLDHLGGLRPGESKPVPPWPDDPPPRR